MSSRASVTKSSQSHSKSRRRATTLSSGAHIYVPTVDQSLGSLHLSCVWGGPMAGEVTMKTFMHLSEIPDQAKLSSPLTSCSVLSSTVRRRKEDMAPAATVTCQARALLSLSGKTQKAFDPKARQRCSTVISLRPREGAVRTTWAEDQQAPPSPLC